MKVGRNEPKFPSSRESQGFGTSSERITSTFSLDLSVFVEQALCTAFTMCQALNALHINLLIYFNTHFLYMMYFLNLLNNPMRQALLLAPLYRRGNQVTET